MVKQRRSEHLLLCDDCRRKIVAHELRQCHRCGGPLTRPCADAVRCSNCNRENFSFISTIALGEYRHPFSPQILSMKRERDGVLAHTFTRLLCHERQTRLRALGADLVIPVPMHQLRYILRGVNSAEQIARGLASYLDIPCETRAVCRCRWTPRQATLPGNLRRSNLTGAFNLTRRATALIRGKKIILADDVMTTGSTCSEIARLLYEGGAAMVTVAVLARAEIQEGTPIQRKTATEPI
jgi:ComF family protein